MKIPSDGHWISSSRYQNAAPYNNFHSSRFDFWRSQQVSDLFDFMENSECGFFRHAWGDANYHAVAADSLLNGASISRLGFFPVQHNWNFPRTKGDSDAWAFDPDQQLPTPVNTT